MRHKELCALAVDWLRRPASRSGPGCSAAVSESGNYVNREIVDAIGWRAYEPLVGSVLVEVKTSRADFLADRRKKHRSNTGNGIGKYRYFMVPEGLLDADDLPEKWGLLVVNEKGHIRVVAGHVQMRRGDMDVWAHCCNEEAEKALLIQCLSRVGNPQKVQDSIRMERRLNSRLMRENAKLQKEIRSKCA
ncbi:adenylosuccinate synthase [Acidithiobacillus sp. VAN18-1]|uniref:Adenylosuccinate synthase n=2 Tax=Igneacidithiobacillus copahuensis TaxID=2724909 RepID=A0AAE3CK93_9PROT|nr:adenylosuccinate synthase [Igneacidithiobacillus copahuensis]MBU2796688.1 adenylosuccinate synthase [Acidithiobacillus sp. VAN18-2]